MIDYRIPLGALAKSQQSFSEIGKLPQNIAAGMQQGYKLGELVRQQGLMPEVRKNISDQFMSGSPDRNIMLGELAKLDPLKAASMMGSPQSAGPSQDLIAKHRDVANRYRDAISKYVQSASSQDPQDKAEGIKAMESLDSLKNEYNQTLGQMSQFKGLTPYMIKVAPISEYLTDEQDRALRTELNNARLELTQAQVGMIPLEQKLKTAQTNLALMEQGQIPIEKQLKELELEKARATTSQEIEEAEQGTPNQKRNAGFYKRMLSAHNNLDKFPPPGVVGGAWAKVKSWAGESDNPFVVAASEFITPNLRDESGAAIGKDEFTNADSRLIPKSGDSQATLQIKRRNRENILEALKSAAGPALGGGSPANQEQSTQKSKKSSDPLDLGL